MTLGQTAKDAIEAAGLSPDFGPAYKSEGSSIHACGQQERWLVGWGSPPPVLRLCTASQRVITRHLEAECGRVYGAERVRVERGHTLVSGAVRDGQLLLEGPARSTQQREFDLDVGADGVHSMTRQLMTEQAADMTVSDRTSVLQLLCAHLSPQGDAAAIAAMPTPSGRPFNASPPTYAGPPLTGASTAVILPASTSAGAGISNLTVSFKHGRAGGVVEGHAVLVGSAAWFGRAWGGATAAAAELAEVLPHFPTVWLQEIAATLVADFRALHFITCSKLASGRALLVGDAGHAMSPSLGMGCNIALQDTLVMSEAITAAAGDVAAAAQRYSDARCVNAQAVVRISERLDSAATQKHHRSLLRAAPGWPLALTVGMNYVPKKVPIPGVLRPSVHITASLHDAHADFRKLEAAATWYFLRLVAIAGLCGAATAGAGILLWRLQAP